MSGSAFGKICVGLFGTCGSSEWRKPFTEAYGERKISYFDPQVPVGTWHKGMVEDEDRHLLEDDIILFPITSETTAQGSLAEVAFSILHMTHFSERQRYLVFFVDETCKEPDAMSDRIAESVRTRHLIRQKLRAESARRSNVFLVESLESMLELSIRLHGVLEEISGIEKKFKNV